MQNLRVALFVPTENPQTTGEFVRADGPLVVGRAPLRTSFTQVGTGGGAGVALPMPTTQGEVLQVGPALTWVASTNLDMGRI